MSPKVAACVARKLAWCAARPVLFAPWRAAQGSLRLMRASAEETAGYLPRGGETAVKALVALQVAAATTAPPALSQTHFAAIPGIARDAGREANAVVLDIIVNSSIALSVPAGAFLAATLSLTAASGAFRLAKLIRSAAAECKR